MKYSTARAALEDLLTRYPEFAGENIAISTRGLSTQEAIGNPERKDFPLITGKEVLVQANLQDELGQAFTADPIEYSGSIQELLELPASRIGIEALIVASLNALARKIGLIENTIHCINNEPEDCAQKISQYVLAEHGKCKVGIIGYQPAILENCVITLGSENVAITDLNPDNIGQKRYGVLVLDGEKDTLQMAKWADIFLVTGTILANATGEEVLKTLGDKPVYFFGTTAAAMAKLNGHQRLCYYSK